MNELLSVVSHVCKHEYNIIAILPIFSLERNDFSVLYTPYYTECMVLALGRYFATNSGTLLTTCSS